MLMALSIQTQPIQTLPILIQQNQAKNPVPPEVP